MVGIREKRVMDMSIESRSRQFGKVFDHWQIKEFLGSGSGGKTAVFRLQRIDSSWGVCALKIVNLIEARGRMEELTEAQLTDYQAAREECSRNAEREVRLMDELRGNTNIVDYLDHTFVDWSEENAFGRDLLIRMELLTDLRSELRQGKCFAEAEIIKIGRDICTALVRCHSKNILHRDVKPENIFRNKDGDYKLGDFGVSRVLDVCPGAVASTGIGTYEYWPAEQMTGSYDKRVDVYSLGLVLYELSNRNRLPFAATTYATGKEVSLRLAGTPMKEPTEVSPVLARVVLKACAFKPADRYQSAEDFLKALDWLSRKNHVPIASPEFLEQDVPSVRFETVPARPSDAPKTAFETQPAQNWASNSEPQPARSRKNTGGSYLKEQNHRKKRKNKRFFVYLTALLLCVAVGVFAGQRIWMANKYSATKKLLTERKFEEAITAFEALGDYQDSPEQMESAQLAADYEAAKALLEEGKNEEAVAAFEALGDYCDSLEQMENAQYAAEYAEADRLAQLGKTAEAAMAFYALGEKERSFELWDKVAVRETISTGLYHTVGLTIDGTVVATGREGHGAGNIDDWSNIIAVSAGDIHTVGLKDDGTVVAVGNNDYGQCNVDEWTDIVAVSAGSGYTMGLKADGTVVSTKLPANYQNAFGQCDVGSWSNIVAVSAGYHHTVGLKSDGTVVAVGRNDYGQCNVSGWTDIVAVSAGVFHTVGIKSNGTVVKVGNELDTIYSWTDVIAVGTGFCDTVGLKSDGTVITVGGGAYGDCNVNDWIDIIAITAGDSQIIGHKSDGTLVATGDNSQNQLDIQDWNNIMLPNSKQHN